MRDEVGGHFDDEEVCRVNVAHAWLFENAVNEVGRRGDSAFEICDVFVLVSLCLDGFDAVVTGDDTEYLVVVSSHYVPFRHW